MKYTNFHQIFTVGNTRKVSADFFCWLFCDVIKFRDDHTRMHINDPLASIAYARERRIVAHMSISS